MTSPLFGDLFSAQFWLSESTWITVAVIVLVLILRHLIIRALSYSEKPR
jgi:hypothetical protein